MITESRVCGVCPNRYPDGGELCAPCGDWRHELEKLCGLSIPVEIIRCLLSRWMKPGQCVTLAKIAGFCRCSLEEVVDYCEGHNVPILGQRYENTKWVVARQYVPVLAQALRRCRIPNCSDPVESDGLLRLRLCRVHHQYLIDHFSELDRPLPLNEYEALGDGRAWITVDHFARLIHSYPPHVYQNLIHKDRIKPQRFGGGWRIPVDEVWRFIGQLIEALPLYLAKRKLGMSKMQLAHFLACKSCNITREAIDIHGRRVLHRNQLPFLLSQAVEHRAHNALARRRVGRTQASQETVLRQVAV